MKKLFRICVLSVLICGSAFAAGTNQVSFSMQQLVGTPLDRTLVIKPVGAPWFDGTNTIYGDPITNRTSNGTAWTNLYAGTYTVALSGLPGTITIDVTNSAVVQFAAQIARRTPATQPAVRFYNAAETDAAIAAATNGLSGGSGTVGLVSSNDSSIIVTPSVISAGITNFGLDVNTNVIASVAAMNGRISTNTIGATVNAITYGLVADGVTDNTVALSNLLNGASNVVFPAGSYLVANPVIVSRTVNINGAKGAEFRYTGSSNSYFLTLTASDCTIRGMKFIGLNGTNTAVTAAGGAINLNATGFSSVENCAFESLNGNCIFFEGTGNLYTRSNHCLINGNTFWRTWSPIVGGANEKTEFSTISYNRASVFGGTGIKVSDPNVRIFGNEMLGYMSDPGGTIDTPQTGYGLKVIITNSLNRGHCSIIGNNFSHNEYDIWIEGVHGFGDSGMITLGNNIIGGGHYAIITNCVQVQITGGLIGPSANTTPFKIMNCTNVTLSALTIQGAWDLGGTVGLQIGSGVYSNGVLLAMAGNGGSLTNLSTNNSPSLAASIQGAVTGYVYTNVVQAWKFAPDASIILDDGGRGSGAGEIEAAGFYGGSFSGNGASLTNLNASSLASGTVASNRFVNIIATNINAATVKVNGNQTNDGFIILTTSGVDLDGTIRATNASVTLGGSTMGPAILIGGRTNAPLSRTLVIAYNYLGLGTTVISPSGGPLALFSPDGALTGRSGVSNLYSFSSTLLDLKTTTLVRAHIATLYSQPSTNGLEGAGGSLGCNGTNWWTVMRDSAGVLATNKFTLTTWP